MNIAETLIKSLGINPADVQQAIGHYGAEYRAFKEGFQAATRHFNARLEIIEKQNDEILRRLGGPIQVPVSRDPVLPHSSINGPSHDNH